MISKEASRAAVPPGWVPPDWASGGHVLEEVETPQSRLELQHVVKVEHETNPAGELVGGARLQGSHKYQRF